MSAHAAPRDCPPPPPAAAEDELMGVLMSRSAYRMPAPSHPRHRAPHRHSGGLAVVGGVTGMTFTAITVKTGAVAAISSVVVAGQALFR